MEFLRHPHCPPGGFACGGRYCNAASELCCPEAQVCKPQVCRSDADCCGSDQVCAAGRCSIPNTQGGGKTRVVLSHAGCSFLEPHVGIHPIGSDFPSACRDSSQAAVKQLRWDVPNACNAITSPACAKLTRVKTARHVETLRMDKCALVGPVSKVRLVVMPLHRSTCLRGIVSCRGALSWINAAMHPQRAVRWRPVHHCASRMR
jgi:hypothetical protein